jgi:hypothetical protein
MGFYDVFNGDADGLCALHQLRLVEPRDATPITGTKRDIALVRRVPVKPGDRITVCDISLETNAAAVIAALDAGAAIEWFDHHRVGNVPPHPSLVLHHDPSPAMCTSAIVDRHLGGAHRAWAVVGAFGDNLDETAAALARTLDLDAASIAKLKRLGECLNYNAYGDSVDELLVHPVELLRRMAGFASPADFAASEPSFALIDRAMQDDVTRADALAPIDVDATVACYELPDAAWSRRVSGAFANRLARAHPHRAHAVLTPSGGAFTVSIRAPIANPRGADRVAVQFERGGGREAAAGINGLPAAEVPRLLNELRRAFRPEGR